MTSIHFPLNTNKTFFFLSMTYKSWILQGRLRHAMHQALPVRVGVPSSVHVLTAAAGHHGPDGRVVEIHVEVRGDLPAILDVKQWQGDVERLHLTKKEKKEVGLRLSLCWMMVGPVVAGLTFVVGPSSFSATQLCRLKARSWQFTNTRLPNFSSNCFTSGSIPEKSSF